MKTETEKKVTKMLKKLIDLSTTATVDDRKEMADTLRNITKK